MTVLFSSRIIRCELLHRLPHTTNTEAAAAMDKTTTTTMMTTTIMDRERQLQWMKSHNNYRRPLPARHFEISEYTTAAALPSFLSAGPRRRLSSRRRRRGGCDFEKMVSIFFPFRNPWVRWSNGKFQNEFIAFHRSVYFTRIRYTVIYYIFHSFKNLYLSAAVTPHSQTPSLLSTIRHHRHRGRSCYKMTR